MVMGSAALEFLENGRKQIWAAITVSADRPSYNIAQQAVLANSFEVTLEGEAHDPTTAVTFGFRAKGQLIDGRVDKNIQADCKSTAFVFVDTDADN